MLAANEWSLGILIMYSQGSEMSTNLQSAINQEWKDSALKPWSGRVHTILTVAPIAIVILQASVIAHAAARLGRLPLPGMRLGFQRGLLTEQVDPGPETLGFHGAAVQATALLALLLAPIGLFLSVVLLVRAFDRKVGRAAAALRAAIFVATWTAAIYLNVSGSVSAFSWFWT